MVLGAGCFIGTCSDIGAPPTADGLPVLRVGAEASPLTLGLSDGSGIAAWNLTATPATGGIGRPLAAGVAAGPGQPLVTFDAPGSGRWLLEADVTFDLERGAYAAYAVLEVP